MARTAIRQHHGVVWQPIAKPPRFSAPAAGSEAPTRASLRARSSLAVSWIGLGIVFATAAVSMYLVQVSSVATAGYELQRLEAERDGWLAKNQQLELQLDERRSLTWVETEAAQRLSMERSDQLIPLTAMAPPDTSGTEVASHAPGSGPRTPPNMNPTGDAPSAPGPQAERPEPGNPGAALNAVWMWIVSRNSREPGGL